MDQSLENTGNFKGKHQLFITFKAISPLLKKPSHLYVALFFFPKENSDACACTHEQKLVKKGNYSEKSNSHLTLSFRGGRVKVKLSKYLQLSVVAKSTGLKCMQNYSPSILTFKKAGKSYYVCVVL